VTISDPKQEAIDHALMQRDDLAAREQRTTIAFQPLFRYRRVIYPDGTVAELNATPSIEAIRVTVGCRVLSSVKLADGVHAMFMDDLFTDTRPNPKATALYLARCKPGTETVIRGVVVVVPEEDFGGPL